MDSQPANTIPAAAPPILRCHELRFGFGAGRDFLGPISLDLHAGQCSAIIGPNGAGKSTLLRLMAGLLPLRGGRVQIPVPRCNHATDRREAGAQQPDDAQLADMKTVPSRDRARIIAYLPQHVTSDLDMAVRDLVLLGRYPHRSVGIFESIDDQRIADEVMELTETASLADRSIRTLSGGEAQRAHLAAALAQQPQILLLDEPTASMDLRHQIAVLDLLRRLAVRQRIAVVVTTHDVNLAARYCAHVILMGNGEVVAMGLPGNVVRTAVLRPVFGIGFDELDSSAQSGPAWLIPAANVGGGNP